MLPTLKVNGESLTGLLAKNGITQSFVYRRERSVVTMDGKERYSGKKKRRISVSLVEMPLERWMAVAAALNSSPGEVSYLDELYGPSIRTFRISDISATTKVVQSGRAYIGAATFVLTEV